MVKFRSLLLASFAAIGIASAVEAATYFGFDQTVNRFYREEFDRYAAAEWTLTTVEAGAGSATEALTNIDGGALLITNDAADDDSDFFQLPSEGFKYESGKRLFFKARLKVSDATQSDFVVGLQITDTTPLAVTDGIYFRKDDGDANIDFVVMKDSTATTATAIATATTSYVTLAFYYDPSAGTIVYMVNDEVVGSSVLTNVPDDEELTVSFGLQNGEAVAKTMTVDYITVWKER